MPEPNALDFPRYLGSETTDEDRAHEAELRRELAKERDLAEMFTTAGWAVFWSQISDLADRTRRELETCPLEEVTFKRAQLAWWKEVLDLPSWTAQQIVNLQTRLAEFETPQPEED